MFTIPVLNAVKPTLAYNATIQKYKKYLQANRVKERIMDKWTAKLCKRNMPTIFALIFVVVFAAVCSSGICPDLSKNGTSPHTTISHSINQH